MNLLSMRDFIVFPGARHLGRRLGGDIEKGKSVADKVKHLAGLCCEAQIGPSLYFVFRVQLLHNSAFILHIYIYVYIV